MSAESKRPAISQRARVRAREVLALRAAGHSWERVRQIMARRIGRPDRFEPGFRATIKGLQETQVWRWRSAFRRPVPKRYATRLSEAAPMSASELEEPSGLVYEALEEVMADELHRQEREGWSGRCPTCRHAEHPPGACCLACAARFGSLRSLAEEVQRESQ